MTQIQSEAQLSAVLTVERPPPVPESVARIVVGIRGLPVRVQSKCRFNLDHLGAEVGKHPSSRRHRQQLTMFDNADPGQRLSTHGAIAPLGAAAVRPTPVSISSRKPRARNC